MYYLYLLFYLKCWPSQGILAMDVGKWDSENEFYYPTKKIHNDDSDLTSAAPTAPAAPPAAAANLHVGIPIINH